MTPGVKNWMTDIRRKQSLAGTLAQAGVEERHFRSESLVLEEVCGAALVRIHSFDPTETMASCPFPLPQHVGACSGVDPTALCLRPGEWLLVGEATPPENLLQQAGLNAEPDLTSVLDVSDSMALFRICGTGAAWLMCKLSSLDFVPGVKQGPHSATTKLGDTAVIVHYHPSAGGEFVFDLLLDRSTAKYAWSLMIESSGHADELATNHGGAA